MWWLADSRTHPTQMLTLLRPPTNWRRTCSGTGACAGSGSYPFILESSSRLKGKGCAMCVRTVDTAGGSVPSSTERRPYWKGGSCLGFIHLSGIQHPPRLPKPNSLRTRITLLGQQFVEINEVIETRQSRRSKSPKNPRSLSLSLSLPLVWSRA